MLDPRVLREDPEAVRASQRARGADPEAVDRWLDLDARHRAALRRFEQTRAQQKQLSKQIGAARAQARRSPGGTAREAMPSGGGEDRSPSEGTRSPSGAPLAAAREPERDPDAQADADRLMAEAASLAAQVKAAEAEAAELQPLLREAALAIDNVVDPRSPVGGEEDFRVIEHVGTPRDFTAEGFEPRDHLELGDRLAAIDVERGAKVSGSRFFYLTGAGALLELALLNLAMSVATGNGLVPVIPPALVQPHAMEATGFLGQAAENVYHLEADDLYLVGTAEVPLAALHGDEILAEARLPIHYVGFSPCFRREAGSHGRDTRGIIRVHQFDKVEMFTYCRAEDAGAEHDQLLAWERQFMDLLEIPYRVIDVATGDLGASAARKFDIEAWIPTQRRYREVTSTSNCTTFQARRLNIRYRDGEGRVQPVATLNGTLVAMPRVIVALLENHQDPDGGVRVPAALQPYLVGRERLTG